MAVSVTIDPYLEDSSGYRGEAERVFLPSDLTELREIVLACGSQHVPLTIAGAGTGLAGGRVPHGGWVVSLEKFRKMEIEAGRARCGPGVILSDLQQAAAKTKQFFGPNPTEDSASIGGIVSTNAGGARSFHYGSVRRHVLSMEVMLMDGRTLRVTRGRPRRLSGYTGSRTCHHEELGRLLPAAGSSMGGSVVGQRGHAWRSSRKSSCSFCRSPLPC